jgi:hypothetical protein
MTRLLAAAAVLISVAAILASAGGAGPTRPQPRDTRAPASPTTAPTAKPPPATAANQLDREPARTALTYTLAARNWSARTYRAAWRRQLRLATSGYRRRLERARPTRAQLAELHAERASSIAIPAAPPRVSWTGRRGRAVVELHERTALAGQAVTGRTRNQVTLRRQRGGWRVTGWTILPTGTGR